MSLDQADNESQTERFERYIRQLGRAILACSLCKRGCEMYRHGHYVRVPHFQPSIWHKRIMLIKYEPDSDDIHGLFDNIKPILDKFGAKLSNFYCTSIIKCAGDDNPNCPYFELEWKAMGNCMPDLIICFDESSANKIGAEYDIKRIQKLNKYKVFCIGPNNDGLELILKALSSPQTRSRLIS